MQLINNKRAFGERVYYFTYVLSVIIMFLLSTNYIPIISSRVLHILLYIIIGSLFFKVFYFDDGKYEELIWKALIYILAIISWRSVKNVDILLFISFVIGAKNINFHQIIKLFVVTLSVMLLGTVIVSQLGVVKDGIYIRDHFERHSLGIIYPTDMAAYTFYLVLGYLYLFFKKISWKLFLIVIFLDVILYKFTQARNSVILILLSVFIVWTALQAYNGKKVYRAIVSFYWMLIPILAYGTLLTAWTFNIHNKLFKLVNSLLSNRLMLSHQALDKYGITLFGNHIEEHAFGGLEGLKQFYNPRVKYFFIDSSLVRLAVIYGLIIGVFVVSVMTIISYRDTLDKTYILSSIMLLVALHCVVEQHLVDISFNPFLIALLAKDPLYNKEIVKLNKFGGYYSEKLERNKKMV